MHPVLLPASPAPRRARGARHRRLILVLTVVAALETAGASLSAVSVARMPAPDPSHEIGTAGITSRAEGSPGIDTTTAADAAPAAARPARPGVRPADEQPGREIARTPAARTSDQAFDPIPPADPAQQPDTATDGAPALPTPAQAGDETTAAAGGLAGAGRAAAVVPHRLRIPELGIDQSVLEFPCDRPDPPDNHVFQWGCAGHNNLYLLGHAYSVFSPLHDAYAAGSLHEGMEATFTDADGNATTYRVATWRVVRPDQVDWAIASLPVPSMTLQTCYGANSEWRLLVRLVAAG